MAAQYTKYTDMKGSSPRSLHRMKIFYRAHENYLGLQSLAVQLGWTNNVVIT